MTALVNKNDAIRELIGQRLKAVAATELSKASAQPHLDEDTIAAFVEGRLQENECQPVLAHLAACGSCRRTSAQIVQLENQVDAEPASDIADEPGRLESLLSKFGSLLPSANEEVVFAYQNPEEDPSRNEASGASESDSDASPRT